MGFACRTNAYCVINLVIVKYAFFAVECIRFRTMDAVDAIVFFKTASASGFNEAEHRRLVESLIKITAKRNPKNNAT